MRSVPEVGSLLNQRCQNVDGMDVMHTFLIGLGLAAVVAAQAPSGAGVVAKPQKALQAESPAGSSGSIGAVQFGNNGWPIGIGQAAPARSEPYVPTVRNDPVRSDPVRNSDEWLQQERLRMGNETSRPLDGQATAAANNDVVVAFGTAKEPLASGMQFDSPLHDVFRSTRSPGAFQTIGGVEVFWRLTIHGTHGEIIGMRDLTHIADCAFPERDRLEDQKGHVFTRDGQQVAAQRNGIPYESLNQEAKAMLELFGLQLRLPWCFGDGKSYSIVTREAAMRRGEKLWKLQLLRRPHATEVVFGPEVNLGDRDQFELLFEPTTGQPRELVHRFSSSGQERRVLLEDWQEEHGVRMPRRRVYVDAAGRATTTIELRRITPRRVSDREFRLL